MKGAPRKRPPPYRPPDPPLPGRRVYAHLSAGEWACPRCGKIHLADGRYGGAYRTSGYDAKTGVFRCREVSCGYRAYLGVVFWPIRGGGMAARPADHVLSPGQAAELRLLVSYAEPRAARGNKDRDTGRRARTNVECTCGAGCAVHRAEGEVDTWAMTPRATDNTTEGED